MELLPCRFDLLRQLFEFLDILGRELWAIELKGQLVQLRVERKRNLIIRIIHAGEGIAGIE